MAPFDPSSYFYVAFFGGVVALAVVSLMNFPRLTVVSRLKNNTYAAIATTALAAVVFLILAPSGWYQTSNIRLGLRVVAVVGGSLLYWLHKGPALGTMQRSGEYTSMWKAIGPILGGALVQGVIVLMFGSATGAP